MFGKKHNRHKRSRQIRNRYASSFGPRLEALEDRTVPSSFKLGPLTQVSGTTPFEEQCNALCNAETEPHVAVNPNDSDHMVAAWIQDLAAGIASAVNFDGDFSTGSNLTVETDTSSSSAATLATGEVQTVLELPTDPPNHPEGVAVDPEDGTVYFGNRVVTTDDEGNPIQTSEILRIDPDDGTVEEYVTLDNVDPSSSGLVGLAIYQGDVYAALASLDPATRGVYRISRGGTEIERFENSEFMAFPNAITFDGAGRLYVTDSFGAGLSGAVWRFDGEDPGEPGQLWVQDDLISPIQADPVLGLPQPGANGVAFYPNPTPRLYVANTERGLIAQIPIEPDGTAGQPKLVAGNPLNPNTALLTVDGIQVDVRGDIYGVIPGAEPLSAFLPGVERSTVVRIDPDSGETELLVEPDEFDHFDIPLSLAFGTLPEDQKSVYVTNGALIPQLFPGSGPGVVQVGVGVKGFQLHGAANSGARGADSITTEQASAGTLTISQVQPLLIEAINRFVATGVDVSALSNVQVKITDLPGATLALATEDTIFLDIDAAGHGWFIDPTPEDDSEFTTPGDQGEQGYIDALTVIAHELGHVLGLAHEDDGLMASALAAGERYLPLASEA